MRRLLTWIVILYCGALAAVWFGRFKLIYPFSPTRVAPIAAGLPAVRETVFDSFDGTKLIVWSAKARKGKATIVYFHGNAGNLANRAQRFDRLLKRGYGLVAMGYRGSSGSQGTPDQKDMMRDSAYLIENIERIGTSKNATLVYYGESLGTGVASQLAVTHPPKALILEAPFKSITDLAASQMPFFPIQTILDQRWDTLDIIQQSQAPLLVLHGQNDSLIPYNHGESVFSRSGSNTKELHILPEGTHHNLWSVKGQKIIYKFLGNHVN